MTKENLLKLLGGLFLLVFLLMGLATPAQAFETRSGDTVIVEADEVIDDDLYVTANTFTLKGTVKGDLVVVGNSIKIASTGVIEQDLMAAGQSVVIEGQVGDDARISGAGLVVADDGEVADDLVAAFFEEDLLQPRPVGDLAPVVDQ